MNAIARLLRRCPRHRHQWSVAGRTAVGWTLLRCNTCEEVEIT